MWVQNDSGTRTPSWAPHGVAYVGGYHTADLLPIVLPTLLKHLPVCCEAEGGSTTAGRTKKPSYMKGNTIQLEMEKRGCSVVGRDLVKVSTPLYADDKELPDRVEALLLFADPSVGYAELNGASSSGRRTVLRGAFGYSLPLLATSLPRVLIDTCRTLRQSHLDASGTPVASSALWISHIAHALGFQSDALLPLCSDESCRDGTLMQLIAEHVLEVLDGADAALTKQMNHNFFLPDEHFSFSADAQCLVNKKGHLLEDFKRRSAS
ncbi:hypothetical protein AGDE_13159 [Angomonas deanei]|nr:hypothetical protein AGDE_13159 [Angomonas deanei]|eukprot:EPY22695.1 hypothetical protein AGDE_13159 [Angomonas deanei]